MDQIGGIEDRHHSAGGYKEHDPEAERAKLQGL